jgi:hypothetical protein
MVFTVRMVATFLREPWCSSMVRVFLAEVGCEKTTETWERSLVRVPRGPVTVTTRERMWIFTMRGGGG